MTYQIACLASQMIFKCRDEQIALAAAKELGLEKAGHAEVEAEVVE